MDRKEQKERFEAETRKITENLAGVAHRVAVFSGKGGVGKTTVSVNLAFALRALGDRVGILDADVTGPNVAKMLGVGSQLGVEENRIVPQVRDGVKVVSMANALSPDQPVIWRGPLRSKLLQQFLGDVGWGALDYLVADLPPGTGDEIITIAQRMEPDLAIIVTTPQEVSLIDSRRAINMARKMGVVRIALVENMSGLLCPDCGREIDLFGKGGGERQAHQEGIAYLGALPIDPAARRASDEGVPIVEADGEAPISRAFRRMAKEIRELVSRGSGASVA
jgi:ATP-binding protein involved in chromosome partitioning